MSLTLVTGPTQEPVTIEEVKAQLRLDEDADDELLRRLLVAARIWVEGQTHKALMTQTWDQYIDNGWPTRDGIPYIRLEKNPVTSVTSVTYETGASPQPTLAASRYIAVTRDHASYIAPAYGETWPDTRYVPNSVRVRFVAGYSDVPEPLRHAILMLVAHWYENREVIGDPRQVPYAVEALISPYRS